jgi:hypothetical protein
MTSDIGAFHDPQQEKNTPNKKTPCLRPNGANGVPVTETQRNTDSRSRRSTMSFQTKQELRDLQAELDRLASTLRTVGPAGPARSSAAFEVAAYTRMRAAFHIGRTTFASCLNVIIFGDIRQIGLLRDAVKEELATIEAYEDLDDDWDDDDDW